METHLANAICKVSTHYRLSDYFISNCVKKISQGKNFIESSELWVPTTKSRWKPEIKDLNYLLQTDTVSLFKQLFWLRQEVFVILFSSLTDCYAWQSSAGVQRLV